MTLTLTVLGEDGLTHTYRGAVRLAINEHITNDTREFYARLMAAGGTHDPSLCERCRAVAAAKARQQGEQGAADLVRQLRALGLREGTSADMEAHVDTQAHAAAVNAYVAEYDAEQHTLDRMRALARHMRVLTARVKGCSRAELSKVLTYFRHEAKRCREIADNALLSQSCREQGRAMSALYQLAYDMGMERVFTEDPPKPRRVQVRSTQNAIGKFATYEKVCSCGHGYVH